MTVKCPYCGEEMRQTRRGATLKRRGPSYVCPRNENEIIIDERGHRKLSPDSCHGGLRSWSENELNEHQHQIEAAGKIKLNLPVY